MFSYSQILVFSNSVTYYKSDNIYTIVRNLLHLNEIDWQKLLQLFAIVTCGRHIIRVGRGATGRVSFGGYGKGGNKYE